MSTAPYDLYDDPHLVNEIVVDTLTIDGLDSDVALRLADGDADHPWSDIVRALCAVATAYGHPITGTRSRDGLRHIVGDLLASLHANGDDGWLASTERPSALVMAHLIRLQR